MNWKQTLPYEQPVNELIRVCLRIEQLFQQIHHHFLQDSLWDSRECLHAILEVVSVLDRSELKAALSKELSRHYANLSKLSQMPNVDNTRLSQILDQLASIVHGLNTSQGKLAGTLRENEFLNTIRLQLTNIGGACNVNTPALNFWLKQNNSLQKQQLADWFRHIEPIQDIIVLLLKLVRESSVSEFKTAPHGFYEVNLDPKQSIQLIRVELPTEEMIYPEISAGRHRSCIRFMTPDFMARAIKVEREILFKLTCCIL